MPGRWYTESELVRLQDMAQKGHTAQEIATAIGRTRQAVSNKAFSLGIRLHRHGEWSAEEHAKLQALAKKGYSASRIGEELGRTRNAVIRRCHDHGVLLGNSAPTRDSITLVRSVKTGERFQVPAKKVTWFGRSAA